MRMLVTVAHPDDETFGCGSLIAHAADDGATVTVVCATRGEAGDPAPGRGIVVDGPEALGALREAELREAADALGVARVEVLSWRDSGMDGDPAPGTLCAAPVDDVARTLTTFVDEIRPDVVVTLDGSDGHRDHVHVRDATVAALDLAAWDTPAAYLHCLPRALMQQWVLALQAEQPGSDHLHLGELGTPEADITTVIDTEHLLERREQAMALHRTQVSPYEVMPADLRREFLRAERLVQLRPTPGPGVTTELVVPGR